ncbi:hypothetical protein E2562_023694 [Oryza meyeriana var. granulata]|uniref:Uncharacterized protein n=1 Tax=Oryza meyeriana var. granulata TaxID=110450 RepID=A0A6G1BNG0_9ORYZ|nr:hypothetical protein E2562_023694 [Oryza meyeriana var. granulata]
MNNSTSNEVNTEKMTCTMIIPASTYPKQLSFRIRPRGFAVHGGTSMLITNRHGVWSVARRRYVKKTRCSIGEVARWPEYDRVARREITFWWSRVVDILWDAAPERYREKVVEHFRREAWRQRRLFPPEELLLLWLVAALAGTIAGQVAPPPRVVVLLLSRLPSWLILSFGPIFFLFLQGLDMWLA